LQVVERTAELRRCRYNDHVDPKKRPNHRRYIEVLRSMTPEQRLMKAFELSAFSKRLFLDGLRTRFPHYTEAQLHRLALERLAKCHNRRF
jgi:hypothetical protein